VSVSKFVYETERQKPQYGSSKQALSVGVKMADFRTREHQESLHYAPYFSPFNFLKSIPTLGIPLKKLPNLNSK
jgi:hypothetical protein